MTPRALTEPQRRALVILSQFRGGVTARVVRAQAQTRNTGGTLAALVRRGLVERATATVLGLVVPIVRCTPAGYTLADEVAR